MLSAHDLIYTAKFHLAYFILEMRQLVYLLSRFTAHAVKADKFKIGVKSSDATLKFWFGTVAKKYTYFQMLR